MTIFSAGTQLRLAPAPSWVQRVEEEGLCQEQDTLGGHSTPSILPLVPYKPPQETLGRGQAVQSGYLGEAFSMGVMVS